jgi:Core-2/I-Branching enzyme
MSQGTQNHHNAYLILAHEDVDMLNILAQRLINTGFVYIHLDRLSKIQVDQVTPDPKIEVTKQIKVNWGGYSIVEATRLLADQAIAGGATRLTLLSGLSYPIVSDEKLTEFAHSDVEYVDATEVDLSQLSKAFVRRFTSRHFSFHLKQNLFGRLIRRFSREFWARMPRINPVEELAPLKLTLGSQWWSVSTQTYINSLQLLKDYPSIEQYFKKIECSDESFFGTILHNISRNHAKKGTTFVKWGRNGGPLAITKEDIEISQESYLFIRKVNFETYISLLATHK